MYRLRFDKDNGDQFFFDFDHGIIVDLDPLSEISVNISTSQGAQQVGTTVENRMVGGLSRELTGKIVGDANEIKKQLLDVFSPFSSGRLYFNDLYYCDCYVETTPEIGIYKKDVRFIFSVYCAYPFWLEGEEITASMGIYTPCFYFPDPTSGQYEEYHGYDQHLYAYESERHFIDIYNDSEVDCRFTLIFTSTDVCTNFGVENIRTGEKIQINDTLNPYEKVKVYWDNGVLKVEKIVGQKVTDIFSYLDEDSDLFWLYQGDNVLQAFAESTHTPKITIEYNNTYVGVYDGMGEES